MKIILKKAFKKKYLLDIGAPFYQNLNQHKFLKGEKTHQSFTLVFLCVLRCVRRFQNCGIGRRKKTEAAIRLNDNADIFPSSCRTERRSNWGKAADQQSTFSLPAGSSSLHVGAQPSVSAAPLRQQASESAAEPAPASDNQETSSVCSCRCCCCCCRPG